MTKKILVIGSLNMDIVAGVERMLKPGETIIGNSLNYFPGGKGANQACAAAKLGADVTMLGVVGSDQSGEELIASLSAAGVKTGRILQAPQSATGTAIIYVDQNGQNSIVSIPGANYLCGVDYLRANDDAFAECDYVLLQMEIPYEAVEYAINRAYELCKTVTLNPAPAPEYLQDGLIEKLTYLTPNETELSALCGFECGDMDATKRGAQMLLQKGAQNVIVTLGKQGSVLVNAEGASVFNAFDVKAVDTTGAGDCYNAALLTALANGKTVQQAGVFASAASGLAVTKHGAQSSLPTLCEVEPFMRNAQ